MQFISVVMVIQWLPFTCGTDLHTTRWNFLFDSRVIFLRVFLVLTWLVSLAELSSCFLPRFFEAPRGLSTRQLPEVGSRERCEQGYQPWLYLRLHSGSASLIHQGDYRVAKPPTLDPTINRVWLTTVARCRTLQFTWYKFPYFTEIIGKNIAWDFGSRISSKISARISASASKISACCGPLEPNLPLLSLWINVFLLFA